MPTSHPSMSLLALSKASFLCPGHPDTADGSSSFCITRQTMPSNTGNCLSLPSLSQSSAPHLSQSCSDGEGMSLSPGATGLEGGSAGSWILRVIEGRRWGWVSRGSIPQEGAGRAEESLWLQPERGAERKGQGAHPCPDTTSSSQTGSPKLVSEGEGQGWGVALAASST